MASLLIGAVIVVMAVQDRHAVSRIRAIGEAAVVEPVNGYTRHKRRGSTTYSAQFSFTTAAGQSISRHRSFPEEVLADLEQGAPVTVQYDPSNPSDFVFEKEQASWLPLGMGVAFIVLAVFVL